MSDNNKLLIGEALPLSFQHLLAMFVGTIVPPILIAGAIGASIEQRITLIQSALFVSAIATFIQLFPLPLFKKYKLGSGLPMMMGMSYVFLGLTVAVAKDQGLPVLFGSLLVASIIGVFMGFYVDRIKKIFTPLISGVLVICMGIGLYPSAVKNFASGIKPENYGDPKNIFVGLLVVFIIAILNKIGRGMIKNAAIVIGMIVGYIVAIPLGMVDFSSIAEAGWLAIPKPMAYGIEFDTGIIITFTIAYAISIISLLGCGTVTTFGAYGRPLKGEEIANSTIAMGVGSVISSLFGSIPMAGLTQNAAIISINKKTQKVIFVLASLMVLVTSISPKIASCLISIPNSVIGGGTLVIFGMITISGMGLLNRVGDNEYSKLIAGISIAISIGITYNPTMFLKFSPTIQTLIGKSSLISGVIIALILQELYRLIDSFNSKKKVIQENI
ncbi:uracil-xanthine permease family protein [Psychrilyobacter atlanticus]|uniref:uracil-xanthine permease family protein n=1 Tax=Psychrilyobacter atlanticus TaxID=271091 RepID=UPI000419757C|nr:solute carrier family 23 protein [Psychrilyobacter atlanticus]